jgi:hypothetical protein
VLRLHLIAAKICGHQSAEKQDKWNRAQDDFENSMMPDNDAQNAGATPPTKTFISFLLRMVSY